MTEPAAPPTTVDGLFAIAEAIHRLAAAIEARPAGPAPGAPAEPARPTSTRVDGLLPDDIIPIRHNLGSSRVRVRLFAADDTVVRARVITVVTRDECEAIVEDEQQWPSYAIVEVMEEEEPERPVAARR